MASALNVSIQNTLLSSTGLRSSSTASRNSRSPPATHPRGLQLLSRIQLTGASAVPMLLLRIPKITARSGQLQASRTFAIPSQTVPWPLSRIVAFDRNIKNTPLSGTPTRRRLRSTNLMRRHFNATMRDTLRLRVVAYPTGDGLRRLPPHTLPCFAPALRWLLHWHAQLIRDLLANNVCNPGQAPPARLAPTTESMVQLPSLTTLGRQTLRVQESPKTTRMLHLHPRRLHPRRHHHLTSSQTARLSDGFPIFQLPART